MFYKCRDVAELAPAYVDRDLAARDWFGVRLHLMICGMCRAYIDQWKRTVALLHRLPFRAAEAPVVDGILARIGAAPDPADRKDA